MMQDDRQKWAQKWMEDRQKQEERRKEISGDYLDKKMEMLEIRNIIAEEQAEDIMI